MPKQPQDSARAVHQLRANPGQARGSLPTSQQPAEQHAAVQVRVCKWPGIRLDALEWDNWDLLCAMAH